MTSVLIRPANMDRPGPGSPVTSQPSAAPPSPSRDRSASSFTALTRSIHEMGLMRRRYGYYWAKLIGAVLILIAWVVVFIWIGDSWWQLANAGVLAVVMTQIAFLGHDSAPWLLSAAPSSQSPAPLRSKANGVAKPTNYFDLK
jgi:hypothetical protein